MPSNPGEPRRDGGPRLLNYNRPLSLPVVSSFPHVHEKRRTSFTLTPFPPPQPPPFHYPYRPLSSSSLCLPFPCIALPSLFPLTFPSFFPAQKPSTLPLLPPHYPTLTTSQLLHPYSSHYQPPPTRRTTSTPHTGAYDIFLHSHSPHNSPSPPPPFSFSRVFPVHPPPSSSLPSSSTPNLHTDRLLSPCNLSPAAGICQRRSFISGRYLSA